MSHLPIGATPDNPQYVTLQRPPQSRLFTNSSGQIQLFTGAGEVYAISIYEQASIDIWDHVGGGPSDADLIVHQKDWDDFHILQLSVDDGARVRNSDGKETVYHFSQP